MYTKLLILSSMFILLMTGCLEQKNDESKFYGNVDVRTVSLGFRVSGKIKHIYFEEGERIKQGDVIASLDDSLYKEYVNQINAQIEVQKAKIQKLEKGYREEEIAKALQGNYKLEHLFVLKQALAQYDFYLQQIEECDAQMEAMYAALPPSDSEAPGSPPPKPKGGKRRKNQAHFDLATSLYHTVGIDLTAVDGLDALTVQSIITEIGIEVSAWPTVKHFTSWLCLAPYNDISGGKVLRSRTKKTQNRANLAFRLAAQSLSRSQTALGAFYRRMKAKHGPAKATTATAHKLARIVWAVWKHGTQFQSYPQTA
mgnify:CR=1 FL=1